VTQISPDAGASARDWLRQLRVHQWSKNMLLVLPLILAHKVTSLPAVAACFVAVVAFSLCASAVYIINDLIDMPHDREHPTKSKRPVAQGVITIRQGVTAAGGLSAVAALLSIAFLPWAFLAMLVGYAAMSLTYSVRLKRVVVLEVVLLAGFYVYRVLIGVVAISVPVSFWLLAFSMFFFLALGIIKRYADLVQAANLGQTGLSGRSYTTADIDFFRALGMSSSAVAVLVLALYLQSYEVTQFYSSPKFLWLVCPLALYWIMRAWLMARRGKIPDDLIVFALRDRASYMVAGLTGLLILLATVWGRGD